MRTIRKVFMLFAVFILIMNAWILFNVYDVNNNETNALRTTGGSAIYEAKTSFKVKTLQCIEVKFKLDNEMIIESEYSHLLTLFDELGDVCIDVKMDRERFLVIEWASDAIKTIDLGNIEKKQGIRANDWITLTINCDAKEKTLDVYINGINIEKYTRHLVNSMNIEKINFGGYGGTGFLKGFAGEIGSVKMWNDVQNYFDVIYSENHQATIKKEKLIGEWHFTEKIDSNVGILDLSSNQYDIKVAEDELDWVDECDIPQNYDYSMVAIPDTQILTFHYQPNFTMMTRWIKENVEKEKIAFVMHLGDIENDCTDEQFIFAAQCMDTLNNAVPYSISIGNHDYQDLARKVRDSSLYNKYFPLSKFQKNGTYAGTFEEDKSDNTYYMFTVSGVKYLIFALEFAPRSEVLSWASEIVQKNSDYRVIVTTHAYLNENVNYRDEHHFEQSGEIGSSAKQVWDNLLSRSENVMMLLCGHVGSIPYKYRLDDGINGNKVAQIMSDLSSFGDKTEGAILVMKFYEEEEVMRFYIYSPSRDQYLLIDNTYGEVDFS